MIRINSFPEGYKIEPWENVVDKDSERKLWIVNQLMGETAKGDELLFARVTGENIELFTGLLRDKDGEVKALVSALFSYKHDGVFTEYDYEGIVGETECTLEAKYIAVEHDKKIRLTKVFNWALKIAPVDVVKKVFGSLIYEPVDTVNKYRFIESIKLTER